MTTVNENSSRLPTSVSGMVDGLLERRPDLAGARGGLLEAYGAVAAAFESGGILYVCGNGGSFADAVHIKGELAKSFELTRPITEEHVRSKLQQCGDNTLLDNLEVGLPVVVLGESDSLRSAYENDRDARLVYAQELNSFVPWIKAGVLIGISTSGNAENVVAAMKLARAYGLTSISLTGPAGGKMAELSDIDWRAPGACTADIQENQLPLYHTLCRMLEARFFA